MGRPPISAFRRSRARQLRAGETAAERQLWRALKRFPMKGSHFRRQAPIGPYVVDFACMASRLVIELDGSQHADASIAERDAHRTRWLEKEGYRVLRFWNSEVVDDLDGVLEVIHGAVYGSSGMPTRLRRERASRGRVSAVNTPPRRAGRADPPPEGEGGRD